jgi:NADH:ubiquinone oxidoreductase subunit 3 (subunit A)
MYNVLLSPPMAFFVVLLAALGLSLAWSRLAPRPRKVPAGRTEPYACGEDSVHHMIQPDYSQFFPFAFYFTILHVAALMAATVPAAVTWGTFLIAVVYVAGVIVGLLVLYRR